MKCVSKFNAISRFSELCLKFFNNGILFVLSTSHLAVVNRTVDNNYQHKHILSPGISQ